MNFDFVYLGQTVLKYRVPLEVFNYLQKLYQVQKKNLPKANKQLVGKIKDEVSLFFCPIACPIKPAIDAFRPNPKAAIKKKTRYPRDNPDCESVESMLAKYTSVMLYNV